MELVSKKDLLMEFEVKASFYNVKIGDRVFECRNQAKINRIGFYSDKLDAIFILCNPGSCDPRMKEMVPALDPRSEEVPFIQANSDPTQEQIMRLMKIMQWNQISIINLSDLCSGNLADYKTKLKDTNNYSFTYHSIFSNEREDELEKLLHSNLDVELIAGWGTEPCIKNIAEKVFQHRLINNIKGWKHNTHPFYYHPNPHNYDSKKEWIDRTLQSIGVKLVKLKSN
ncbi:hypothetical protein ACFP7A_13065 [Sporolactobacillus kofuensis]|uniref:DUF1643 domain-containing protein n=1 Tax=Sporolactobacillus kofuensis TaxID=269672 RepID=A0ABW1WGP3_9BACL|nr:hypothetical protein [Sporolactobacillus kofuensis]MCO7176980.1 hypothetical protein [Sporolactobacillus kofuensis]